MQNTSKGAAVAGRVVLIMSIDGFAMTADQIPKCPVGLNWMQTDAA